MDCLPFGLLLEGLGGERTWAGMSEAMLSLIKKRRVGQWESCREEQMRRICLCLCVGLCEFLCL